MMNPTQEFKASSQPTTDSESRPKLVRALPAAETRHERVIWLTVQGDQQIAPSEFLDIGQFVASLEADEENARGIAKGRQRIAKVFYGKKSNPIAYWRLKKGWSQKKLADAAGTSQSYVARIETGRVDPQVSTVNRIALALGVPVEKIIKRLVRSPSRP